MAKQRIIAITGASGGLAQEIVKQLSPSDGIILLGRDKDKLEKCYRHVENKTCLAIDLRDDNGIREMVDYLYQRFGQVSLIKLIPLELILRVLKSLSSVLNTWLKRLSVFWAKTSEKSICQDS